MNKQNPYCAFKDDVERRKALLSRDVRIAVIAALGTISAVLQALVVWHFIK